MDKKYKVEFLPIAKKDMTEIAKYIGQKLCNPTAAESLAEKMIEAAESLKQSPYMYPIHYPIRPLKHEYRKIPVDNNLMFYWVDEKEKCVIISRVIYAKRGYGKIIK